MNTRPTITEDSITGLASAAGIDVPSHRRAECAETLNSLRAGVIAKAETLPPDTGPAVRMNPRWGAGHE